nr:hypothetical protein [Tanacetum cinerariifolium]
MEGKVGRQFYRLRLEKKGVVRFGKKGELAPRHESKKTAWPIMVTHESEKTAWPIMVRHADVKIAWPSVILEWT